MVILLLSNVMQAEKKKPLKRRIEEIESDLTWWQIHRIYLRV